jgi:hypothetical protein
MHFRNCAHPIQLCCDRLRDQPNLPSLAALRGSAAVHESCLPGRCSCVAALPRRRAVSCVVNMPVTQHSFTSPIVTIDGDGDVANARFYEQALHFNPELGADRNINSWILYGRVEHEYRRTPSGWKLSRALFVATYDIGNRATLATVS